jgi:hypothetical protein
MSFIIAVYTNEGMILASDRRITFVETQSDSSTTIQRIGTHVSNSADKTFRCPNRAGISMCGDAALGGRLLNGRMKDLIRSKVTGDTPINAMPQIFIDGFSDSPNPPDTHLIIAGYDKVDEFPIQVIKKVYLKDGTVEDIDTSTQGAIWDGEINTLARLLQNVAIIRDDGSYSPLPNECIAWNYFTLQDAVDFARFAVDVTIETMRFKDVVETVGGGVDLLAITPDKTWWIDKRDIS